MSAPGVWGLAVALTVLAARGAGLAYAAWWASRAPVAGLHPGAGSAPRVVGALLGLGAVTAALAFVPSVPWTWLSGACACEAYGGLHVCPLHPEAALGLLPPLAAVAAVLLVPAGARALRLGLALRDVARLTRGARPTAEGVYALEGTGAPLVFAAGVRRARIYVDGVWWSALPAADRAVIAAHERAHVEAGDPRTRLLLDLGMAALAPRLRARVVEAWALAAELAADAAAVRRVGDPLAVAEVLMRHARDLQPRRAVPHEAVTGFCERALEARVRALLGEAPVPAAPLRGLAWALAGAVPVVAHLTHRALELGLPHLP